ncbi:hypothetical protein BGZ68_005260 [Mortierella alpina]|nr:hypothetical protein BGZ68_005260 [Mortierella alpina]
MDNYGSSSSLPHSEDVVMSNNDIDNLEDLPREESHHRRSASYTRDDERDYSNSNNATNGNRSDSRDRRGSLDHRRSPSRSRSRDRFREDKYDTERHQDRSSGARNRSRSPARGNGSSGAGSLRDRRVYVGNLSYDVKWTDLKDFMREIGAVAHADVLLGSDGRSKGCGVVEFQRAEHAQEAIRKLNDVVLMGRPIFVREDRETEGRIGFSGGRGGGGVSSKRDVDSTGRQVYVSNDKYGPPAGGRGGSHGPSSVDYRHESSSSRDRDRDRERDRHRSIHDSGSRGYSHSHSRNDIFMDVIPSGPAAGSGDQIYVRNLPLTTTEQDLRDLFRTCGPMRMTEILLHGGRPKGSGVVRFEHYESADKAVAKFNGYVYGGRPLEIMYDRA